MIEINGIKVAKSLEKGKTGYEAEISLIEYISDKKVKRYYVNAHSFEKNRFGVTNKSLLEVEANMRHWEDQDFICLFDDRNDAHDTRYEPYVSMLENLLFTMHSQNKPENELAGKVVVL